MKVLIDHSSPFLLAHGGLQIQIEETKQALEEVGVDVEFLRWWEETQRGDIIHFFGRPTGAYIDFAHQKNIRVVISELLTGLGARTQRAIGFQRIIIQLVRKLTPSAVWAKMAWDAYEKADRVVALTSWEAELMHRIFNAPPDRVVVIPNGVANAFFLARDSSVRRRDWLICTATITPRKRVLELAQAAVQAQVPVRIIGRAYADNDAYAQTFFDFAGRNSKYIQYDGPIEDRRLLARAYRESRGFVLLSEMESLSLSALEAAACECPLLLSDLPWARSSFNTSATYCPVANAMVTAKILRRFYDAAPNLRLAPKPLGWTQVGQQLKTLYEGLLRTS